MRNKDRFVLENLYTEMYNKEVKINNYKGYDIRTEEIRDEDDMYYMHDYKRVGTEDWQLAPLDSHDPDPLSLLQLWIDKELPEKPPGRNWKRSDLT